MKRSILLFGALLTFSLAFSQTPIYTETFGGGIPSGWINSGVDANSNVHTGMWKWTNTGNHSSVGWPTVALHSPTASNGWIIFDSDSLDGGGSGATRAPQRGYLTSTPYNLTGHSHVLLQFYQLYYSFAGNPRLVVSNGSLTDTFEVDAQYNFSFGVTPNPSFRQYDITNVAANQSAVTVTFLWDNGYYFYWQVDDLSLIDAPVNDLAITRAGSYNYNVYPLSQVDTISYYARVENIGSAPQPDSRVSLTIKKGATQVFTDTTPLGISLAYTGTDSALIGNNFYIPGNTSAATGTYTCYTEAFSDSVDALPFDNGDTSTFAISDSIYAVDNGVYGGSFNIYDVAQTGAPQNEWFTFFYVVNPDTLTSIIASFDGTFSAPNAVVQGHVYAVDPNTLGTTPVISTEQKLITAANLAARGAVKPVSLMIDKTTGAADAAILQPGYYAISLTNINDSAIYLTNCFSGIYGFTCGQILSGSGLTFYNNTHFYLRMAFGHNFNLLEAAFTRTPGINPLKVGQPVTFVGSTNGTGDNSTTYSWTINGLNSGISQTYSTQTVHDTFPLADSFQVCLTVTDNGNTATTCSWIRVRDIGVGINDISPLSDLTMIPNPSNGRISINADNVDGAVAVTVVDLLGNVVKAFSNQANGSFSQSYDLSALSNGIYIVKIENAGNIVSKKLSISKQ